MQEKEILEAIKASGHNKVKLAVVDIDGVLRGKVVHMNKFLSALERNFGFCDVIFGWDMVDTCYDNVEITGWHTGYPDARAAIASDTFRLIPWDENMPFFLADFSKEESSGAIACPRTLLKKIADRSEDMGFKPLFSQEFEWFTFKKNDEKIAAASPEPITTGMFGYSILRASANNAYFNDLFDTLGQFGVPLEGLHTETGPGVYEACIQPESIVEAADRAVLFKTAVKEIANNHNFVASFMAKWNDHLPGCGGHIHQSLWDIEKNINLFYNQGEKDNALLQSYIAGQLKCLPEILPMFAPTINSYKRLNTGDWAPATLTWGFENRTTALRVINGNAKQARLETRVPGADVNPYLTMAACLASGLYGIKNQLKLETPAVKGNGYKAEGTKRLPRDLKQAVSNMKKSEIAAELFGEAFVDHFIRTREWEWEQFTKSVTDWELKRYFEII